MHMPFLKHAFWHPTAFILLLTLHLTACNVLLKLYRLQRTACIVLLSSYSLQCTACVVLLSLHCSHCNACTVLLAHQLVTAAILSNGSTAHEEVVPTVATA